MRFLILFTVHNITHYQGDKGLFSDKKGLILVSGGSKAVFMALNFAGTGAKLLFEACTKTVSYTHLTLPTKLEV